MAHNNALKCCKTYLTDLSYKFRKASRWGKDESIQFDNHVLKNWVIVIK